MKTTILLLILSALCSCRCPTSTESGRKVDAAIRIGNDGKSVYLIPFVHNISNCENIEIYQNPITAIKIESVHVDGKLLDPMSDSVCLDEIDQASCRSPNDSYIYMLHSDFLISLIEFSSKGFSAVRYSLPKKYNKAVIVYRIRNVDGLSGIENTVSLYQDHEARKKEVPVDFSDSSDW
ncbi:hypothetical protein P4C99_07195 [Pontiellaceae bacterium B1224]|nr:hypothetical protein [Pontiellaceae bacterium B1224]